jgi:hypothetical protein
MAMEIFCFYSQNKLIQASQTGGQRYSDTSRTLLVFPASSYPFEKVVQDFQTVLVLFQHIPFQKMPILAEGIDSEQKIIIYLI